MDTRATERQRDELPSGAAPLVDIAIGRMRDQGLVGQLPNGTIEFVLGGDGRVRAWFAHSRGGRLEIDPDAGLNRAGAA